MALETFNDGEARGSIRAKLNANTTKLDGRASLSDSTTQKPGTTSPTVITLNTVDLGSTSVTNVAGELTLNNIYRYELIAGFQVERTTAGGSADILIWAQADVGAGFVDISNSTIRYTLDGISSTVLALNVIIDSSGTVKIRFMQKVTNSTKGMGIVAAAAGADYPAIPSAIVTIT